MNFSNGGPLSGRTMGLESQNERMRKAIARNRAKQDQKLSGKHENKVDERVFKVPSGNISRHGSSLPPELPQSVKKTSFLGRKAVALAEKVHFNAPFRAAPKKAPAIPAYGMATSKKRRKKLPGGGKAKELFLHYLVYAGWVFCLFLFFRLIFGERGVYDYFKKQDFLQGRTQSFKMLSEENKDLRAEIHRIKVNVKYQKNLVRDHLGFIAKDEYLILFHQGKVPPSI